jgi:hypothetical protein
MAFRYNDLDGAREPKPYEKGRYQFPLLDQEKYNAKLQFQTVETIPATFTSKLSAEETLAKQVKGELDLKDLEGGKPARINLGDKCDLYVPQAMQINDTLQYETPALGAMGAGALAAAQAGQGLVSATAEAVSQGLKGVGDLVGALTGGEVSRLGAVRAAQLQPSAGISGAVSIAAQAALNPNIRTMFRGVNLREFTFQFKFIPASYDESLEVRDIINFFRYHAYPEEIVAPNSTIPLGYEYPDMFRIKVFSKVNGRYIQTGTRIKDCYLRSIATTYNPQASTYHYDGMPTEIDLTLSFVEHRTLSRGDIEKPGSGIDVDLEPTKRGSKFTPLNATEDDIRSPN